GANAVGVVTLSASPSTHLASSQHQPASVTAGRNFDLTVRADGSSRNLVSSTSSVATFSGLTLTKLASTAGSALAAPSTTTTPNPLLAPLVLDSPDLWDGLRFKKRPWSI